MKKGYHFNGAKFLDKTAPDIKEIEFLIKQIQEMMATYRSIVIDEVVSEANISNYEDHQYNLAEYYDIASFVRDRVQTLANLAHQITTSPIIHIPKYE